MTIPLSGTTEEIKPRSCRFHDLRHTAVSRMLNAGVPLAKVAKIVGWSASTMALMASRYGHFSLNELRDAVEKHQQRQNLTRVPWYFPRYRMGSRKRSGLTD